MNVRRMRGAEEGPLDTTPNSILCSQDLCETKPLPSVTHEKVQPLSGWGRKRGWLNF